MQGLMMLQTCAELLGLDWVEIQMLHYLLTPHRFPWLVLQPSFHGRGRSAACRV